MNTINPINKNQYSQINKYEDNHQKNQNFKRNYNYNIKNFYKLNSLNCFPNYCNKEYSIQNERIDENGLIQSLKYVSDKYSNLKDINQVNSGLFEKVRLQSSPKFFVIKSFTEEDIHKVISYLK